MVNTPRLTDQLYFVLFFTGAGAGVGGGGGGGGGVSLSDSVAGLGVSMQITHCLHITH